MTVTYATYYFILYSTLLVTLLQKSSTLYNCNKVYSILRFSRGQRTIITGNNSLKQYGEVSLLRASTLLVPETCQIPSLSPLQRLSLS
jgi:hypothetical protein